MCLRCCPPSVKRLVRRWQAPIGRRRLFAPSTWLALAAVLAFFWLLCLDQDGAASRFSPSRHLPPSLLSPLSGSGTGPPSSDTDDSKKQQATTPTAKMASKPTPPPSAASGPTVALAQGTYSGLVMPASNVFPKAVEAFRGVPYADTTAGQNRFRPPVPLPASSKTFDAVVFGPSCPKLGQVEEDTGEACLNANIYRPANLVDKLGYQKGNWKVKHKKAKLPVVVYIHGGGFNVGRGRERNMASFVAWAEAPIIGVNFNYRVGALGFLPSALAAKEGLLNLGLRDQQHMLEWVRDNIQAFGGDPDNVTLMGVSAGAHSIGHHIIYYADSSTPDAPFAKAILESGAATARAVFYPTHPRHLIQFREFLIEAGVDGIPESEIFSRLRELPLSTIVTASKAVWDMYEDSVAWPFQPVIDGPNALANSSLPSPTNSLRPIIPDLPITSWRERKHLRIPVLTGFNTNEGTVFVPPAAETDADFRSFFRGIIPTMTNADLDALCKLYPDPTTSSSSPYKNVPSGMGKQWARLDAAYSHYAYICPVIQTAHFLSTASAGDKKGPKVHLYRFAPTSIWGTANHGDEAPVVAHDTMFVDPVKMPGLTAVSDAMHGAWARFAVSKHGNLNDGKHVEWPVFESPFSYDFTQHKKGWFGRRVKRDDENPGQDGQETKGKMVVFGEGNNEGTIDAKKGSWLGSIGRKNKGTPMRESVLSDLEERACQFWWDRIELSQGFGYRDKEWAETDESLVAGVRSKL
ncbi:Alpha/Beta hydrolase protein [Podospora didyma]|uniref:Alpha/Beta hydrolase protein n=1 Tax=Podospora didyma TaxID=330526 RepID=A0AAE0U163_9PEZI|nr:Alpha/Beta hydrolase protein [Podospora didyma]